MSALHIPQGGSCQEDLCLLSMCQEGGAWATVLRGAMRYQAQGPCRGPLGLFLLEVLEDFQNRWPTIFKLGPVKKELNQVVSQCSSRA